MTPMENVEIVERLQQVSMPKTIIADVLYGQACADRAYHLLRQANKLMNHPKPFL